MAAEFPLDVVRLHSALAHWLTHEAKRGIIVTDTRLRIAAWNRWMEVHSGRAASDVVGRSLLDVYPEIAGPVIAGTSLFGGRGSVWGALLGALVIGSISNGMDLLGLKSEDKFLITGGVLLAAVVIDALIRNEREKAGARR